MWDGFNKRKFPRLHLGCEVVIHPQDNPKAYKTTTENVGMGGVCVMLNEPMQRFERCHVSIELRDGEPPLQCSARSVWVIPSGQVRSSQKHFDTGIEFLNISDFSRQRLQAFLTRRPSKKI